MGRVNWNWVCKHLKLLYSSVTSFLLAFLHTICYVCFWVIIYVWLLFWCICDWFPALVCNKGQYGPSCQFNCDCLNDASCHPITGECHCAPGWTGTKCEIRKYKSIYMFTLAGSVLAWTLLRLWILPETGLQQACIFTFDLHSFHI